MTLPPRPPSDAEAAVVLSAEGVATAFREGRVDGPLGPLAPMAARLTPRALVLETPGAVLKLRRPRRVLGLDLTTRTLRTWATEQELWIGRRASPHVYLGDASLRWEGERFTLVPGLLQGEPVVAMNRLDDFGWADLWLASGPTDAEPLRELLGRVATFHEEAPMHRAYDGWGAPERVPERWREALRALDGPPGAEPLLAPEARAYLAEETEGWLEVLAGHLVHRVMEGRIRHLHADLRLEHLHLGDEPAIIDPGEGDDDEHWGDTAEDVAMIGLELDAAGRPDLAEQALDIYAGQTWDRTLRYVTPLFKRLAAVRRAAAERALADEGAPAQRASTLAHARSLAELALAYGAWPG